MGAADGLARSMEYGCWCPSPNLPPLDGYLLLALFMTFDAISVISDSGALTSRRFGYIVKVYRYVAMITRRSLGLLKGCREQYCASPCQRHARNECAGSTKHDANAWN